MVAANFSLPAYLDRIGFAGRPAADLATLTQMMQCQLRSVPFENLDVQAGRPISIRPEDIVAKIVERGRGGYCYEVNGLFAMACEAIGIPYRLLGARPVAGRARRPRSHMVVLARVDGGEWLCDTGYGRFGLRQPLDIDGREPVTQDYDTYRIVRMDDELRVEARLGGDDPEIWNGLYSFNLSPFEPADFIPANWYNSTHPDAIFVQWRLLVRQTDTGRHVLFADTLKTYERGRLSERILTPDEAERTIEDLFGLKP